MPAAQDVLAVPDHVRDLALEPSTLIDGCSQPQHSCKIEDLANARSHGALGYFLSERMAKRSPSTTGKPRNVNARTITRMSLAMRHKLPVTDYRT